MEGSHRRRKSVGFSELKFEGRLPRSSIPDYGTSQAVSQFEIDQRMKDGLSSIALMDPFPLECRRQRRMRVRETIESKIGPWDTERNKLDICANKRIASEDTRRRILRAKRENLTRTEIEVEVVKDNIKTQARDAEVEVDRELLFKKEIDYEIKKLWQLEVTRWELELEIPSLLRKVELSDDERAYLTTSVANSYVHQRWCMAGPIDKQPWYYRPVDRKRICEDCRADEEWEKKVKERSEMP